MPAPSNISGQTPDALAAVLTRAFGSTVEPDMITLDIRKGAPVNPDGTISLIQYVVWLLKQETHAQA